MVIDMQEARLETVAQIQAFLDGTCEVGFVMPKSERNGFIVRTLRRLGYSNHNKADKGILLRYLMRMTGLSRQQLTRLVCSYVRTGKIGKTQKNHTGFVARFTTADIALLVEVDVLHNTLSGPATKKIMERAWLVFGDTRFERLASISVAHLYNLRGSKPYQAKRRHWTKTRSTKIPIGVRRAPQPNGKPGYIRIDSVHQSDQDGVKGVYHINAVDSVTQFQLVATCEKISEAYLLPVLQRLLEDFPFVILGFHADNGSEYINYQVATLLQKLLVEFTKSRPRHSNDNALAESKNGAVIRKCFGYSHIPQHFASLVNDFCSNHLNPYVNYHRPCFFPQTIIDAKGKERKRYHYQDMQTPYEKLKSLPDCASYLKPGISFEQLDVVANGQTDNQAAYVLNKARAKMFEIIHQRSQKRA